MIYDLDPARGIDREALLAVLADVPAGATVLFAATRAPRGKLAVSVAAAPDGTQVAIIDLGMIAGTEGYRREQIRRLSQAAE